MKKKKKGPVGSGILFLLLLLIFFIIYFFITIKGKTTFLTGILGSVKKTNGEIIVNGSVACIYNFFCFKLFY